MEFVQEHKNYYEKLNQFQCSKAMALQKYLADDAIRDDVHYTAKTYVIFDLDANMIVAYFSIRTVCVIRNYLERRENETIEDDKDNLVSVLEDASIIVDKYSEGCIFMHMEVEEIIKKFEGGKSNVSIFR